MAKMSKQELARRVELVGKAKNTLLNVYNVINGLVSDTIYGDIENETREQRVNYEIVGSIGEAVAYLQNRLNAVKTAEKTPFYRPIKKYRATKEAKRQLEVLPADKIEDMWSYATNAIHPNTYEPDLRSSFYLLHYRLSHGLGNADSEDLAPAQRAWDAAKLRWHLPKIEPAEHLTLKEFLKCFIPQKQNENK